MIGSELKISALVPERYAAYRPVVTEAFAFFVERLALHRREEISAGQALLSPQASLPQRFAALIRCCPTLHKLGQVMARDRRLDLSLRIWLQTLESLPPGRIDAAARKELVSELAGFDKTGVRLGSGALAEASVAVVLPFSYSRRPSDPIVQGVFKVLKPGVGARLDEELAIWSELGAYIDGLCADYGLPEIRYEETLNSIAGLLVNEIHLDREQAHMGEAAALYSGSEVTVPGLLPFCTPRLTAMERVYGTKVTETGALSGVQRIALADKIAEALIARSLWSRKDPTLFHADPHAGNLLRASDGALTILDWSLVGRLGKSEREQMVQILLCALRLDGASVARAISALAESRLQETALRDLVDNALSELAMGKPPGFRWLLGLLDDLVVKARAEFGRSLIFFRKSILTLDGVLADITTEDRLEHVLSRTGLFQIMSEWQVRGMEPLSSRSFGSHVSNLDLLRLYWSLPQTSLRFWLQWYDAGGGRDGPA